MQFPLAFDSALYNLPANSWLKNQAAEGFGLILLENALSGNKRFTLNVRFTFRVGHDCSVIVLWLSGQRLFPHI